MQEYMHWQTEYYGRTTIHPLALTVFICLSIYAIFASKHKLVLPFILITCLIPSAQRIVIAGLDFTLIRLLLVIVWIRIFLRNEIPQNFRSNPLDAWILIYVVISTLTYTVLFSSVSALVNRLGASLDALGLYYLFRIQVHSIHDFKRIISWFCTVGMVVSVFFFIERITGRNFFSVFGGVPEITAIREGRLRCQGAFVHPIIAGVFWASLLPPMAGLYLIETSHRAKRHFARGMFAAILIIFLSSSSTPILGIAFGLLGGGLFLFRRYMKLIRWSLVILYIALDIAMEAPVWHLLSRINVLGGSTGYHRYLLIENTVRHFKEWWLVGTRSTTHWGHLMFDITNEFIAVAVSGGLITLLVFLILITSGFKNVGRMLRIESSKKEKYFYWSIGTMLFVHITSFFAVSYFGQMGFLWYFTLAITATFAPTIHTVPFKPMYADLEGSS